MSILKLKWFDFGWGSAPDTAGGAYSTPHRGWREFSRPIAEFQRVLLLREGEEEGRICPIVNFAIGRTVWPQYITRTHVDDRRTKHCSISAIRPVTIHLAGRGLPLKWGKVGSKNKIFPLILMFSVRFGRGDRVGWFVRALSYGRLMSRRSTCL